MQVRQRKLKRSTQELADRPTRAELDRPAGERGDVFLEGVEAEGLGAETGTQLGSRNGDTDRINN